MRPAVLGLFLSFLGSSISWADNLGTYGQTYPIEETDFLVFIENRLDTLKQTGELNALQKTWAKGIQESIVRPKALLLSTQVETTHYHYDPTFIAGRDVFNVSGQVVVKKGTRVNPLKYFPLFQETLIFYNDDDGLQRAFVQHYFKTHSVTSHNNRIKPILVAGNVKKAAKALGGIPVYFDQSGKITQKLHIEHVPAVVTRDKEQLLITIIGQKELERE